MQLSVGVASFGGADGDPHDWVVRPYGIFLSATPTPTSAHFQAVHFSDRGSIRVEPELLFVTETLRWEGLAPSSLEGTWEAARRGRLSQTASTLARTAIALNTPNHQPKAGSMECRSRDDGTPSPCPAFRQRAKARPTKRGCSQEGNQAECWKSRPALRPLLSFMTPFLKDPLRGDLLRGPRKPQLARAVHFAGSTESRSVYLF